MKIKILLFFIFLSSLGTSDGYCQLIPIRSFEIGDTVKEVPSFKNLINYPKQELSLMDLRGKLVIIDFWTTGCGSCISSIPRMEKLQEQFKDKIQIILVNPWESPEKIQERLSEKERLRPGIGLTSLPNVYGDTIWRKFFPHITVPHHIWIDPDGVVIASTTGQNATPEHVQQVLNGKKISLSLKKDALLREYNSKEKGLIRLGDTLLKPLFYSAFVNYSSGIGSGSRTIVDTSNNLYRKLLLNGSALSMFKTAYRILPVNDQRVILEVKDSTALLVPKDANLKDKWSVESSFSYEIALPLNQKDNIYSYMQQDINRFFSIKQGIQARLEKRTYQCYVLKRVNDFILKNVDKNKAESFTETAQT